MKMSAYLEPSSTVKIRRSMTQTSRATGATLKSSHTFFKTGSSKAIGEAPEISPIRRLAAVLAADVAGYSRLMGRNEEGTLERLMAHRRDLVEPKIVEHHGRIVKTTGDGILAEFASVVDAVRCAVEMQRGMAERNAGIPIDERLEFRVGINLSDVISEGDDIYGDGVNVAARVEALADAGGVFISNTVYDHVRDRLPFVFEDLGEQQVKNIARPVRVYRIPISENAPTKTVLRAPDRPSPVVLPFNISGGQGLCSVAGPTLWSPRSLPSDSATKAFCPVWQEQTIAQAPATVIVIDDDLSVREALAGLLRSVGLQTHLHGSVPEFLKAGRLDGPTCLVLDVRLPGQSGLDFQRELISANIRVPIIFITGYADIPMSVRAIKGGAIEFLTKPFRDQDLLDAVQQGLARDHARLENEKATATLRARFETLTLREHEVMALVVTGRLNKQIAYDIGISEITVKGSRVQVMRKMDAASLPDLARMADKLNLTEESPRAAKPSMLPLSVDPATVIFPSEYPQRRALPNFTTINATSP
jgi:FixJ family two-component response regulator/class 3 adenylate cyclase